jgi:hypothetical protein
MPRALGAGACLVVAAAVALGALALAFNLTSDPGSSHFDDASRADVSAYVLVFLGMALAAAARGTGGLDQRGRLAAAAAGASASALAACIVGVVWAFRTSGFQLAHAYAVVSFARTFAFAALALGVLEAAVAWRKAVAVAALLGVAALVCLTVGLVHEPYGPLLFLATTLPVLAAAAAVSARQPGAGGALGRR